MTFSDAERIILHDGAAFIRKHGADGVVGAGVGRRNDAIRFIITAKDNAVRERLARALEGEQVSGLPVYVETGSIESLIGTDVLAVGEFTARTWPNIWRELLERPGFLIVGASALAAMALALL
jgi:hypothetical protein